MQGIFTALITPFRKNKIDYDSLSKLIEFQIKSGINGILPCGTTGESPTLSTEEHNDLIKFVVEKVAKRVKILANTGSNSTTESIYFSQHAKEIGADACMLVSPYYNKPTQEGLYQHFKTIAREVNIDFIIYNIPSRTSVFIENKTFFRLKEVKNIIGIKDAVDDINYTSQFLNNFQDRFIVFSGNDTMNYPIFLLGGKGSISVLSNLFPKEVVACFKAFKAGNINLAKEMHFKVYSLTKALFIKTNPIPVKEACYLEHLIDSPEIRLPLTRLDKSDVAFLTNEIKLFKKNFNLS